MSYLQRFIIFLVSLIQGFQRMVARIFHPFVRAHIHGLFGKAGIVIGKGTVATGPADIRLMDNVDEKEFLVKLIGDPSLTLGESYMDGQWECQDLFELYSRIVGHDLYFDKLNILNRIADKLLFSIANLQTKGLASGDIRHHYEIGHELFVSFLDSSMSYSCGYWAYGAKDLAQAQAHKMELIARKLKLKQGMRVLDLGCGWGGLASYLAKTYKVSVVGVTVSGEQGEFAQALSKGLPVKIKVMDYRDFLAQVEGQKFDRVIGIEMLEHVGNHNYPGFFQGIRNLLSEDGLALIQTTGLNHFGSPLHDPFSDKYVFPNGRLPYYVTLVQALEGNLIIEDWHNFGQDYGPTLRAWIGNFQRNWSKLSFGPNGKKYDEGFYRMWVTWMTRATACFETRKFQLWQIVLSKNGLVGGYESIR